MFKNLAYPMTTLFGGLAMLGSFAVLFFVEQLAQRHYNEFVTGGGWAALALGTFASITAIRIFRRRDFSVSGIVLCSGLLCLIFSYGMLTSTTLAVDAVGLMFIIALLFATSLLVTLGGLRQRTSIGY